MAGTIETRTVDGRRVEVRRSARRRRTVSAYQQGETTVVLLPARLSRAEEDRWIHQMLQQLARRQARRRRGDEDLLARAHELAARHLPQQVDPASVRWVGNQLARWGSCTPADRTIRLSERLQAMPRYVQDYVLLHELAHLVENGHGPAFHALLAGYPHTDRARGFLDGVSHAVASGASPEPLGAGGCLDAADLPQLPVPVPAVGPPPPETTTSSPRTGGRARPGDAERSDSQPDLWAAG